jgi:hypothetical protein
MGNQKQHREKADRIGRFVESIQSLGFPDWLAIAMFYRALHLVEMMLASKGRHTINHNERREVLRSGFPEILRQFKPLYNYSLLCRYRFVPMKAADIAPLEARLENLKTFIDLEIAEGPTSAPSA